MLISMQPSRPIAKTGSHCEPLYRLYQQSHSPGTSTIDHYHTRCLLLWPQFSGFSRNDQYDGEGFMEAYSSAGRPTGFTEETLNYSMTAKQPPSYDGKASWFRYEELVDNWTTFTTIEAPKRGFLVKSRLIGDAYTHKEVRKFSAKHCFKIQWKVFTTSRTR